MAAINIMTLLDFCRLNHALTWHNYYYYDLVAT
jgi:hypothetical protein